MSPKLSGHFGATAPFGASCIKDSEHLVGLQSLESLESVAERA
jgi:hypothetical protein